MSQRSSLEMPSQTSQTPTVLQYVLVSQSACPVHTEQLNGFDGHASTKPVLHDTTTVLVRLPV